MPPLPRHEFRRDAPAGDVGRCDQGRQIVGQMREQGPELIRLEESRPGVVLAEQRNDRHPRDALLLDREPIRAPFA